VTGDARLVVLQLVANRWWTGSADPVIQLSRGLEARGHRVLLGLIPGGRFEDKAREAGLQPLPGLSLEAKLAPVGVLGDVRRLRRLVMAERVDVVHTHHSHDHWLGLLCRGRATLVRSFHSARGVSARWPAAALYRRSDALIAASGEIAARCRETGVAAERVFRVDGVTDVARFAESGGGEKIREEFGLGSGPVLGCVARLASRRGHEALIRGFALLLPTYQDARLLLVGKGELRARLDALVHDLGLARQVLFTGYRDTDLPAVLDALDVFVLLGAGSDESCRAALEAMAAGRPVVARRVGALGEAVVHGTTGVLLDDDRAESVAAALRTLLEDPDRSRAMGEAGRRRALAAFTPEHHAAQVEAVYRSALGRTLSPARGRGGAAG
jgi:glycosyltransferase involved in cell wall biosynthesis